MQRRTLVLDIKQCFFKNGILKVVAGLDSARDASGIGRNDSSGANVQMPDLRSSRSVSRSPTRGPDAESVVIGNLRQIES